MGNPLRAGDWITKCCAAIYQQQSVRLSKLRRNMAFEPMGFVGSTATYIGDSTRAISLSKTPNDPVLGNPPPPPLRSPVTVTVHFIFWQRRVCYVFSWLSLHAHLFPRFLRTRIECTVTATPACSMCYVDKLEPTRLAEAAALSTHSGRLSS